MATLSTSPTSLEEDVLRFLLAPGAVSERNIDRLFAVSEHVSLDSKEHLPLDAGQDRMVLLSRGAAKLEVRPLPCAKDANTARQVLSFHFAGDLVPVLRRPDADAHLTALTPLDCLVFANDALLQIAGDDPAMLRMILARTLQAVDAGRSGMIQLASASAGERLEHFLRTMATRICGCSKGECEFNLPMSRREIAEHLGLTIETVSRQFAALREAGILETQGRSTVRICC